MVKSIEKVGSLEEVHKNEKIDATKLPKKKGHRWEKWSTIGTFRGTNPRPYEGKVLEHVPAKAGDGDGVVTREI